MTVLEDAGAEVRATRKQRRAARLAAAKRAKRQAVRAAALAKRKARARYLQLRARQVAIHGVDGVRENGRRWSRACYERNRDGRKRLVRRQDHAAATQAAIVAANGNRAVAAKALGICRDALDKRIRFCAVHGDNGFESLTEWVKRRWPTRCGRRSVAVADVKIVAGFRLYILDAHGIFKRGEHVNKVKYSGVERTRVVCQMCKEARTT